METKKTTKWGWIIFWLIIFWPIGLFLLVKKLATDKSALMSGKTARISVIGWILVVFGVLGIIGVSDTPDAFGSIIIALIFIAGGIVLLRKSSKTKKTAMKYKKYIDIVVNQNVRDIDNVAAAVAIPYDIVVKDLQDMIDIGYLKNAYIHLGNREIVLSQMATEPMTQDEVPNQVKMQTRSVRCPGCGANNVVFIGKVSECEYCGTPIN